MRVRTGDLNPSSDPSWYVIVSLASAGKPRLPLAQPNLILGNAQGDKDKGMVLEQVGFTMVLWAVHAHLLLAAVVGYTILATAKDRNAHGLRQA
jgi:hypothetical protein